MRVPLNDLGRGRVAAGDMHDAVARVVSSGWYVHGPEHAAFEREFAAYCGVEHCVGVASGTDALEIALRAVTRDRAGSVLTAANAGGYTSVAARRAGLEVRFADVDPRTMCLDPEDVARRIEGVAVVVVTHLYGRLAPVEEIADLCKQSGAVLLEDCAQAVGARRGDHAAGSFGDISAFSFYPTKNLGALGDGGAVVTRREDLAIRVRALRQYGWSEKYAIDVEGGRNSRLDEVQAAVLRVGLRQLDVGNARRRQIIDRYVDAAASGPVEVLPARGEGHVGHLAVAMADDRDGARGRLLAAGIETAVHYPVPDHRQAAYAAEYRDVALPVTERLAEQVLTLPCFPLLGDDEVAAVCAALRP